MPVQINTETSRLTTFEDHVLAELMRLQCREAELVATINEMQAQAPQKSAADALAEHNTILETRVNELQAQLDALTGEHANCPTVEVVAAPKPIRLAE